MLYGSKTDVLMPIFIEFDVVWTSKFARRAPGDEVSLCLISCCAETILCRTMLNISYDMKKDLFSDDIIFISIKQTSELL